MINVANVFNVKKLVTSVKVRGGIKVEFPPLPPHYKTLPGSLKIVLPVGSCKCNITHTPLMHAEPSPLFWISAEQGIMQSSGQKRVEWKEYQREYYWTSSLVICLRQAGSRSLVAVRGRAVSELRALLATLRRSPNPTGLALSVPAWRITPWP